MMTTFRMSRVASLAAALVIVVRPAALRAQFPATAPAAAPIKPAAFPPFQEATLPNGMRLLVVHSGKQPVVACATLCPSKSGRHAR